MASKDRETTPDIAPPANEHFRRLLENPHQFGLYSALRAIECAYPETPRVAESDHPAEEPVRVAQAPSMSFAPASISDAESTRMGFLRLWQQVVGLFGPNGPMPHHVTETAWQRQHNHDDPTITAFLNVFHHRMVSLFYRARANAEPTLHFDRPDQDRFQDYLASLLGLGVDAFRNRDEMPDRIKFHFVGRLAAQQKNREGLEVILATYLDVPVKIEEFAGQWIELPKDSRNAVGTSLGTTTLGVNTTIGSHVWDCSQKFRIVVGPLSLEEYERLLPGGESLARLKAVVRNYLGFQLQWEVCVKLKREEVPTMQLGVTGRLGWRDWLVVDGAEEDRQDLVLQESAAM